ncbi:hypothetical protein [Caballeronia sp. ATUFL_M2_KS44]|uniref:hypothetical protein n=1 Tax=Caballeronia sp. ATUFL_M2_KS44 TaxID=2921767 RepID=UPI0020285335|nr:hypothetical protein [Caballeronia sp. ATUFL_M2_KS44]
MLVDDLRAAINASWNASRGAGEIKEPELAAAFLKELLSQRRVDQIAQSLAGSLPADTTLVVRGIFAHQNPYAKFTDSAKVEGTSELADLILLREHVDDKGNGTKKGFLIQAKSKERPNTGPITDPREIRQFELYASWPPFSLTGSFKTRYSAFSPPTGNLDFANGHVSQQSRYGIVANKEISVLDSVPWGQDCAWVICRDTSSPQPYPISTGAVFEASMDDVLQRFFNFTWGRDYGVGFPGDWTSCLEFLSKLVKAKKFKHSLVQRRVQQSRAQVPTLAYQSGSISFITNEAENGHSRFYESPFYKAWRGLCGLCLPPDGLPPLPFIGYHSFPFSVLYIGTSSNRPWTRD